MTTRAKDLQGQTFGLLTVQEITDERRNTHVVWKCACSCGNPAATLVTGNSLTRGQVKSCGCLGAAARAKTAAEAAERREARGGTKRVTTPRKQDKPKPSVPAFNATLSNAALSLPKEPTPVVVTGSTVRRVDRMLRGYSAFGAGFAGRE